MKKRLIAGLLGIILLGRVGYATCSTSVSRGHVGVVFDQFDGGVQDKVLTAGRQFKLPWQKVSEFPTVTKTIYMSADSREGSKEDESIKIKAKDGTLQADLTFMYSFDATDVVGVQKKYMGDGDYIMTLIRGQLRGWVSEATSKYSTMEIHQTATEDVNAAITEHVAEKAKAFGITIEKVTLSETKPPEQILQAIQSLQVEENNRKAKEEQLKSLEVEGQIIDKENEIALKKAENERKMNEEKSAGLTDEILQQMWIDKWSGNLPQVMGGEDVSTILNMGGIAE